MGSTTFDGEPPRVPSAVTVRPPGWVVLALGIGALATAVLATGVGVVLTPTLTSGVVALADRMPADGPEDPEGAAEETDGPEETDETDETDEPAAPSAPPRDPTSEREPAVEEPIAETRRVPLHDLRRGDCVEAIPEGILEAVLVVDCRTEHTLEYLGERLIPGGPSWPGIDEVLDMADTMCAEFFPGYLGIEDPAAVPFFTYPLAPLEESWPRSRHSSCFIEFPIAIDVPFSSYDPEDGLAGYLAVGGLRAGECGLFDVGWLVTRTSCNGEHDLVSIGAGPIAGDDGPERAWPGDEAVFEASIDTCEALRREYDGPERDDLAWSTGWEPPFERLWSLGHRRAQCWLERFDPDGYDDRSV